MAAGLLLGSLALVLAAPAQAATAAVVCGVADDRAGTYYDLSELSLLPGQPPYKAKVEGGGPAVLFNVCGALPESLGCGRGNVSVCRDGVALGRWERLGSSWSLGNATSPDPVPTLEARNGDDCLPARPRAVRTQFACRRDVPLPGVATARAAANGCDYEVLMETPAACDPLPSPYRCGFVAPNGVTYDLSALAQRGALEAADGKGYRYFVNVCDSARPPRNVSIGGAPAAYGPAWAYQARGGAVVAALGQWWDPNGRHQSEVHWVLREGRNGTNSVVAETRNGEACLPSGLPRAAAFELICDKTVDAGPVSVDTDGCSYHFTMRTRYACADVQLGTL